MHCRSCRSTKTEVCLDLGMVPLADLLYPDALTGQPEPRFPLRLVFCQSCSLVQLDEIDLPDDLYGVDYPYYSSSLTGWTARARDHASEIIASQRLGPEHLVIEAGSNDGYMLERFVAEGIQVLGIDPAPGPVEVAQQRGVPTECSRFDLATARRLAGKGRQADVIIGNVLLNLLADLGDGAEATRALLAPQGIAIYEVPWVVAMVKGNAYDMIFHQNLSYFSLTALEHLFRSHQLFVNDAVHISDVMGGSLRITLGHQPNPKPSVDELRSYEREVLADQIDFYQDFGRRANQASRALSVLISDLKASGKRVVGYGAAGGMATTLLAYGHLNGEALDYVVDANPHKHGLYTPGPRLRIEPTARLLEDQPDYVLLLAWNYADEILADQSAYRARGGKFIIPVPDPVVV